MSVRVMAAAMSLRCSVRRLFSSEWFQERSVSSRMNISHACHQQHVIIPAHLLQSLHTDGWLGSIFAGASRGPQNPDAATL